MSKKLSPEALVARVKVDGSDIVIDSKVLDLISDIVDSKVLEVNGGIGEISEYLSLKQNRCFLTEERRLCFVYRRSLFKNSKVVEMNIDWKHIIDKRYYDYVIIHDTKDLEKAKKLGTVIINLETMERVVNEKIDVDTVENSRTVTKDDVSQIANKESEDTDFSILPDRNE